MNPPIARQLNLDETKLPAEIFERLSPSRGDLEGLQTPP